MTDIVFFRPLFQIINLILPGTTYIFSLLVFIPLLSSVARNHATFGRLGWLTFGYFFLTVIVSVAEGASTYTLVSSYNKLFLCLAILGLSESLSTVRIRPRLRTVFFVSLAGSISYVLISLMGPSAYAVEWGVNTFLMGFSSQHETAELIVLLIVLVGVSLPSRNRLVLMFGGVVLGALVYALLMTGARTFTVCGLVMVAWFAVYFARREFRRAGLLLAALAFVGMALLLIAFRGSISFFEKSSNLQESSFSNGRDEIWSYYLDFFLHQSTINKLFGSGVGFIAERSAISVGAHNDVLTFLVSFGIVGLCLYLGFVVTCIFRCGVTATSICALFVFGFCALSNGFSGYTEMVIALVLFLRGPVEPGGMSGWKVYRGSDSQIRSERSV